MEGKYRLMLIITEDSDKDDWCVSNYAELASSDDHEVLRKKIDEIYKRNKKGKI